MSELDPAVAERARKSQALVLQRLASVGQVHVAKALGVSESTVSRRKAEDFEELCRILAALDLKVVPMDMKFYRPKDIEPLIELARQRMNALTSAEELAVEDELRFRTDGEAGPL